MIKIFPKLRYPYQENEYEKNYVDLYIKNELNEVEGLIIEPYEFETEMINPVKVTQQGKNGYTFIYQKGLTNAIVLEFHNSDDSLANLTNLIYTAGEWNAL